MSKLRDLILYAFRRAKALLHMLEGLAFLVLGLFCASVSFSHWQRYRRTPEVGLDRLLLLIWFCVLVAFTVLLVGFGLYSFAKARRVR